MNLQSITEGVISSVNTPILVSIQVSTGNTTNADGTQAPSYAAAQSVYVDFQALTYNDIVQSDSINIQGERWKMYFTGNVDGLVRAENKGGDLVTVTDATSAWNGFVFKVALITEHWAGWTSAILTLQDGS